MTALAQAADDAGYERYWLAEHHGATTYMASATTVLMGQVLAATARMSVASGGIMLPNHAPLVVAEQIGTLATLYPGRVDLGLGRAPGTHPLTAAALRRRSADPHQFSEEVVETISYLAPARHALAAAVPGSLIPAGTDPSGRDAAAHADETARARALRAGECGPTTGAFQPVRALPGEGTAPRTWVLGSSVNGARVAGSLGLPFAVASHFAPAQAEAAIMTYRSMFNPKAPTCAEGRPRTAAAVNVMVAPTTREARRLFTTAMAATARILGGCPGPLDAPTDDPEAWRPLAQGRDRAAEAAMAVSFVGTAQEVAPRLRDLARRWELNEIIVVTHAHDAAARRRSYELLAAAW